MPLGHCKPDRFRQVCTQVLTVCSYLRQQHSFTRLQITKELFQDLVDECRIFPKFVEFILDFHWKIRQGEIGPPALRFRRDLDHGFGANV